MGEVEGANDGLLVATANAIGGGDDRVSHTEQRGKGRADLDTTQGCSYNRRGGGEGEEESNQSIITKQRRPLLC